MRAAFLMRIASLLLPAFSLLYGSGVSAAGPLLSRLEQELHSALPEDGSPLAQGIQFVVGNSIWQPGRQYANGTDWLALACTGQGCALVPASLHVSPESWQGHYDDQPTRGQKLTFKKIAPSNDKVLAWLRTTRAPSWLTAGTVPTYHSTAKPRKRPPTVGTLETLVTLPSGESATLVPMLLRAKAGSGNSSDFLLQLRSGDRRQFLAGQLGLCSREITTSYLLWAGDLDRDGRPDYLISFVDADGPIHLYLSGRARDDYLVGLGGTYDAPPHGGECDGMGWLE